MAENIFNGTSRHIQWYDVAQNNDEFFLLDVGIPEEYKQGAIEGAINISHYTLWDNLDQIPKGRRIVIYCAAGLRGYIGRADPPAERL